MSAGGLGEFTADPAIHTHGRASSSKGAVFTHPCSTWGMYPFRHASGTELCQGQTCSPSPLASSPPSFHKSSPSLTLCQPPAKALQPKPILPSCSQRRMGYAAYAHMLSLLSFCPSSRHSGLLSASHPFMLHFPPSATRSLCPPVDPDCLSSTMQAASPPPSDRRTPTC